MESNTKEKSSCGFINWDWSSSLELFAGSAEGSNEPLERQW